MEGKQRQGQTARRNGQVFEDDLAFKLRVQLGYVEFPQVPTLCTGQPFFVRQCRGLVTNIYGGPMRLDFYVYHPAKHPEGLIIETKYQERGGSIDEKLYFTVNSLLAAGVPALLLLIGNGYKSPSRAWCLTQDTARLRVVVDWAVFLQMVNQGYL